MAEDREKEEIHICVLHISFILMYCIHPNGFSKAIPPVETKETENTDADYSTADTLIKQKATHCLFVCGVLLNSINLKQGVTSPKVKLWCHRQTNTC